MPVQCQESAVLAGSVTLITIGAMTLCFAEPSPYGKYSKRSAPEAKRLPARAAWFLQELPSFAVPVGILVQEPGFVFGPPQTVLLGLFCGHYFYR